MNRSSTPTTKGSKETTTASSTPTWTGTSHPKTTLWASKMILNTSPIKWITNSLRPSHNSKTKERSSARSKSRCNCKKSSLGCLWAPWRTKSPRSLMRTLMNPSSRTLPGTQMITVSHSPRSRCLYLRTTLMWHSPQSTLRKASKRLRKTYRFPIHQSMRQRCHHTRKWSAKSLKSKTFKASRPPKSRSKCSTLSITNQCSQKLRHNWSRTSSSHRRRTRSKNKRKKTMWKIKSKISWPLNNSKVIRSLAKTRLLRRTIMRLSSRTPVDRVKLTIWSKMTSFRTRTSRQLSSKERTQLMTKSRKRKLRIHFNQRIMICSMRSTRLA